MSEIDPEKILAELDAARLAQQRESLPVRHRGLLVAVAVVITLLLLALFAFSLLPGGGNRPAEPSATAHLRSSQLLVCPIAGNFLRSSSKALELPLFFRPDFNRVLRHGKTFFRRHWH